MARQNSRAPGGTLWARLVRRNASSHTAGGAVSKEASGWLITADSRNVRTPLAGYWVSLTTPGSAFGDLAKAKTDQDGAFRLTHYRGNGHVNEERNRRTLRVVVKDNVGREIRVASNPDFRDMPDD